MQNNTQSDEIIIETLKEKLLEIHPDRNGGEFKSEKEKEKYHILNKTIENIKSSSTNNTDHQYPLSVVKELLPQLLKNNEEQKIERARLRINQAEEKLDSAGKNTVQGMKVKYTVPKISSTVISGFITTLLILPKNVLDNIELVKYIPFKINEPYLLWILSLFITICVWAYISTIEKKTRQFISYLNDESYISRYFDEFVRGRKDTFSVRDFAMFLRDESDRISYTYRRSYLYKNKFMMIIKFAPVSIAVGIFIFKVLQKSTISYASITMLLIFNAIVYFIFLQRYLRVSFDMLDYELLHELSNLSIIKAESKGIVKLADIKTLADYYEVSS